MLTHQVSSLPVSFDPYVRQGWHLTPIPNGTKGPKTPGWNKRQNTITDPHQIPSGYGVGLCHAYSGTMALDIDDWDRATKELSDHGIDLQALYDAPDAVIINSGNPGHGKLLYAMPFGMALTSKKLIYTTPEGLKQNYLDFRCATASGLTVQDVLPPTIHPLTCKPYTWGGKGNWQRLPTIPSELLTFWQSLLTSDAERTINVSGTIDASWDEIKQALDFIDPSIARDDWVQIGMALHYAGTVTDKLDQALSLYDEWSSGSQTKYQGQGDILTRWKSFKADETGVKLGTLFHHAKQGGWVRPAPDVAHLFASVTPASPQSIIDGMTIHPPVCPIDCFPDVLVSRAKVMSEEYAADPLIPIFAGLAAASAAADKRIRLRLMADWTVPPLLWTMTIGSPSAKKTPATGPMLSILKKIYDEDMPRYRAELQLFEALDSAYASSKKAYLLAAQDAANLIGGQLDIKALPQVTPQPDRPVMLRLAVSDITSQKLLRMAADRPRGLVCILDEMRAWVEKLINIHSGESRSTWVEGYNAQSTTMDRVGDGKSEGFINVEHFALGIHGNIQPAVLEQHLNKLTADGIIQRFIFAVISDHYSDKLNDPNAANPITQLQYEQAIRTIYELPVQEYRLSTGAFESFRQFQQWYIDLKKDERLLHASNVYLEALGKIEGTCGRLMLLMHLLIDPHNPEVSKDTADRAIKLTTDYFIPAMRFVYGNIDGINTGSLESWVFEHITMIAEHQQTVTLSEIRRSAKRKVSEIPVQRADSMIIDAMAMLETNGWATMIESNGKTTKWALNSAAVKANPEHRERIRQAKQRLYDDLHRNSGGKIPRRIAH